MENMLAEWNHFHDWYFEALTLGPGPASDTLTLSFYLGEHHADVVFSGVACVVLDDFGLMNIVNGLHIVTESGWDYAYMHELLKKGIRPSGRKGAHHAYMHASVGLEVAIEFDSLQITDRTLVKLPE